MPTSGDLKSRDYLLQYPPPPPQMLTNLHPSPPHKLTQPSSYDSHGNGLGHYTGLSKVSGCWRKSTHTWLVSASYSAWHFFMDGVVQIKYCKIPKISHGAYTFQRPFLRGLFLEWLIFREAYLGREICVSKSIELALYLEVNLPFLLCSSTSPWPWGGYIWRGDLTEGFLRYRFGGLIFGGAYFWNFKVSLDWPLTLTTQPSTSKLSDNPDYMKSYMNYIQSKFAFIIVMMITAFVSGQIHAVQRQHLYFLVTVRP